MNEYKKIILKEIIPSLRNLEFNNVRRAIYGNPKILSLMAKKGVKPSEISSGVSDRKAFGEYIKRIVEDLKKDRYYRDYYPSKGNLEARKALAIRENYKLKPKESYTPEDFCLTEGSTGAITMVFEYLNKKYPKGEVLIQSPNYYLYKFAANYYSLKLKEIMPGITQQKVSFVDADLLVKNMNQKTKLVIITNPSNPSGEIFNEGGLKKILMKAKKTGSLVLVDELFSELAFEPRTYVNSDTVASKIGAMENLVIIKGYSKSKNLVGLRIGYLYSKNKYLIEAVSLIAQQRSSYSAASNFTGLITLDSFIQSLRNNASKNFDQVFEDFKDVPSICEKPKSYLKNTYKRYNEYFNGLMGYYSDRFDDITKILGEDIEIKFQKISAFNTIVKIKGLENMNSFDFMVSCFLSTGLKTEIAPCFGFDQKTWDKNLGFWLRLTFAKDKKLFREGLLKFKRFKSEYLRRPEKYFRTGLSF